MLENKLCPRCRRPAKSPDKMKLSNTLWPYCAYCETCPACAGAKLEDNQSAQMRGKPCPECMGRGYILKDRKGHAAKTFAPESGAPQSGAEIFFTVPGTDD